MIRHLILMMVITLSVNSSFAQKGKLSFEFGVGLNSYSMRTLNQFYIDSFAEKFELLDNPIKKGLNGFSSVKFQPTELFDIGVYGGYQYGETRSNIEFIFIDNFGVQYETHNGTFLLETEAISIGLTNSWYISHLLKFQNKESTFLQNFRFATELNAGVGFSKITSDVQYPTYKQATFYEFFTSTDFQGQIALKFEYDYVTKPIIGLIGVKIGYQYFKTKTVNDRYNEEWVVLDEYPINLDFSGIFGAIYLSFGK